MIPFYLVSQLAPYTYSRLTAEKYKLKNVGSFCGTGWSDEGMKKYNDIFLLVREDRSERGEDMANELLERHREKRKNAVKKKTQSSTRKRKVVAFDDLMPPPPNRGTIEEV